MTFQQFLDMMQTFISLGIIYLLMDTRIRLRKLEKR